MNTESGVTLRRYTSLNHLATAARGVLQKPDQIQQMYQDFNRVDISNVQDQAGLPEPQVFRLQFGRYLVEKGNPQPESAYNDGNIEALQPSCHSYRIASIGKSFISLFSPERLAFRAGDLLAKQSQLSG
uniref:RFX1-4/6/8-like BCD domain-containing protein n=1 Tax=Parascaris equorum TaxID=6256 RepID=A0A914RZ80_PAREQ